MNFDKQTSHYGSGHQGEGIFPEMEFMRLSEDWKEGSRDPGQWGGAAADQPIFRQYLVHWAPQIRLEFWYRGKPISGSSGQSFKEILSKKQHLLSEEELREIGEVIWHILSCQTQGHPEPPIDAAQAGPLRGRMVLLVRWQNRREKRKFLSMYIDGEGDGRKVHEIHFSAPIDAYANNISLAQGAFRSIQWSSFSPPPGSSMD